PNTVFISTRNTKTGKTRFLIAHNGIYDNGVRILYKGSGGIDSPRMAACPAIGLAGPSMGTITFTGAPAAFLGAALGASALVGLARTLSSQEFAQFYSRYMKYEDGIEYFDFAQAYIDLQLEQQKQKDLDEQQLSQQEGPHNMACAEEDEHHNLEKYDEDAHNMASAEKDRLLNLADEDKKFIPLVSTLSETDTLIPRNECKTCMKRMMRQMYSKLQKEEGLKFDEKARESLLNEESLENNDKNKGEHILDKEKHGFKEMSNNSRADNVKAIEDVVQNNCKTGGLLASGYHELVQDVGKEMSKKLYLFVRGTVIDNKFYTGTSFLRNNVLVCPECKRYIGFDPDLPPFV
ncbi:hypothetical protein ACFLY6_03535, partial [Candidatus Dependentiae bacterium]